MIRVKKELTLEDVDGPRRSGDAAARFALDRRLQRAQAAAAERAKKNVENAVGRLGSTLKSSVPRSGAWQTVHRLLRCAFPTAGLPPSQRRIMPGGGTTFHFEYTSVQPCTIALRPGHKISACTKPGRWEYARQRGATSRPVAHQLYIADQTKVDPLLHGAPGKCFSFGAEGLSLASMCEMWELAERYPERKKNAVIQHRLILELPHSARPEDRISILKDFVGPLEKAGVPFWVAIHAPTSDNDERNVHAHLIFMNRPARQIPWPVDGDIGANSPEMALTWDFAAIERRKDKHRKTRTRFPERQRVPDLLRDEFIKHWRPRYAAVVNKHMIAAGNSVRFDPRSYAAAGITDVRPQGKAGYARKTIERQEPSLIDLLKDLSHSALSNIKRDDGIDPGRLLQGRSAAEAGGKAWIVYLREAGLLADDDPSSKRVRAESPAALASARRYLEAEEALVGLQHVHAAEERVLQALVDASSAEAVARARERLKVAIASQLTSTRHRSVERLASLGDDATLQGVHASSMEELAEVRARQSQELHSAKAAAMAAGVAWLNTFQREETEMSDSRLPEMKPSPQNSNPTRHQPAVEAGPAATPPAATAQNPAPQVRRPGPLARSPEYIARLKEDIRSGRITRVNPHEITNAAMRKLLPEHDIGAQEDARNAERYGDLSEKDRLKANARRSAVLAQKAHSRKGNGV